MSIGRRFYTDNTLSTYPARIIALTPSLSNNGERVTWTLTSNLEENVVLSYEITGPDAAAFFENTNTGTITTNSSGGATIIRNLDKFYEYDSLTNVSIQVKLYSPNTVELVTSSSNVTIGQANVFAATGGNIITFTGGVDSLPGEYTVHAFTTAGANTFTVTNVGSYPSNTTIEIVAIGGGGAGGDGHWHNNSTGLSAAEIAAKTMGNYNAYAGGGGAGGNVNITSHKATNYSATSYNLSVGAGGAQTALGINNNGNPSYYTSPAGNVVAVGGNVGDGPQVVGGTLQAVNDSDGGNISPYTGGIDANRTYSADIFTWKETTGGGGAGANANGNPGSATTNDFGFNITSTGTGGSGGAGKRITITGTEFYAGGGGGGGTLSVTTRASGGTGGGGLGGAYGASNPPTAGTDGLGGGGGGAKSAFYDVDGTSKKAINYYTGTNSGVGYEGASGGSGALYIRYLSKYRQLSL